METTREDQSGNKAQFVDINIFLTFGTVRTTRTAMTPFDDGMILICLGGAPLLFICITTCCAAYITHTGCLSD